jgi:hypothetical protein
MNLRIRTDLNPEWTQILRYFNLLEGDDVHDDDEVEDSAIPESHQLILAAAWHNIKVRQLNSIRLKYVSWSSFFVAAVRFGSALVSSGSS